MTVLKIVFTFSCRETINRDIRVHNRTQDQNHITSWTNHRNIIDYYAH